MAGGALGEGMALFGYFGLRLSMNFSGGEGQGKGKARYVTKLLFCPSGYVKVYLEK